MSNINYSIDEELESADDSYSKEISGSNLAQSGDRAQNTQVYLQIIPSDESADFTIQLEGAVNSIHGHKFTKIAEWNQDSESLMSVFPIALGALFRFHNPAGGQTCTVRMTG